MVTEDAIKMYVNHMKLLSLRKEKRSKEKAEQREEEARKTYKDYDWEGMFHERSLSQLKVVELVKYIAHHNLGKYGTKKAKLEAIKENIIQELAKRIERERRMGRATISLLLIHSVVNQKTTRRGRRLCPCRDWYFKL